MKIPQGWFKVGKEVLRHLLKRPVAGINAVARTDDGRVLLIRRGDTGDWALPGGTLEWGETFRSALPRELLEEAGVEKVELGQLLGIYSEPDRDPRFHAVTVVVEARISEPARPPCNPVEILEVRLFRPDELPESLSHGHRDMLDNAMAGWVVWE